MSIPFKIIRILLQPFCLTVLLARFTTSLLLTVFLILTSGMGNKKIATTFTSLSTRHPPVKRKIREEDILNLEGRRKSNFKPPKKIQFQVTAGR
jgi:hypothetical protein